MKKSQRNTFLRLISILIFDPTFRESGLIDHRAPGAGQLVEVKANGKFILGVGLQILHQEALLIPGRHNRGLKGRLTQNILHFYVPT